MQELRASLDALEDRPEAPDETDEAVIDTLVDLFMPDQAMSLVESEAHGKMVHTAVRAYCLHHYRHWTSAEIRELAEVVRKRIEYRLMEKRRERSHA